MGLYQEYFHFARAPFGITPDPGMLMLSPEHRKALGALTYGIRDRKGFIVVTGEVGIGKTTILRACLQKLEPDRHRVINIYNPQLDVRQLYAAILAGLIDDYDAAAVDDATALEWIYRSLLDCYQTGVNVVLAIDEAQHVPPETLESLRLISNFEADECKLLQIVLIGQTELDVLLSREDLRQLDQRVAVRVRMVPLSLSVSIQYIAFRLEASGYRGRGLFSAPAQYYIALHAKGIPRTLNIFCDNALVNCLGHNAERVTFRLARDGIRDLLKREKPDAGHSRRRIVMAIGVTGLIVAGLLGGFSLAHFSTKPVPMPPIQLAALPPKPVSPTAPKLVPPIVSKPAPSPAPAPRLAVAPAAPPRIAVATVTRPAPLIVPPQPAKPVFLTRTVHVGDTFLRFCRQIYGHCPNATVKYILKFNPTIKPARILIGSSLRFPDRGSQTQGGVGLKATDVGER